jgi:Na+/H+-dicarboxylate symporter
MKRVSRKSWAAGILASAMIAYFSGLSLDAGTVYCYIGPAPLPTPPLFQQLHLVWAILALVVPGVLIGSIAGSNYLRVAVFSYLVGVQWFLVRIYRDLHAAKILLSWSDTLWQMAVIQALMLLFGIAMAFIGFRITRRLTTGSSARGVRLR